MVDVDAFEGGIRIKGLIGTGELAKATRAHQLFFINGRSVRCPLLTRALEEVCRSRVTIGMYPMCVLNLTIPHTGVDVNVHPNKLEVRFRDAEMVRSACERLLATAFEGEKVLEIKKLTTEAPRIEKKVEMREIPLPVSEKKPEMRVIQPAAEKKVEIREITLPIAKETGKPVSVDTPAPEKKPEKPQQMQLDFRMPANSGVLREDMASAIPEPLIVHRFGAEATAKSEAKEKDIPSTAAKAPEKEVEKIEAKQPEIDVPPFSVIGVAFNTYILVETGDSLLMIDQHAAHERLQYEKYMALAEAGAASQQLLTPLVIHVSAKEMALIEENKASLNEAGYDVEPFGDSDIQVRAVPFIMGKAEIRPLFMETLQSLGKLKAAAIDARRASIMQMACKSAVKAGDRLTDSEISALIADMLKTGAPPTCPHGRPVAKVLSKREIEKMFKRIQ